jgi:hypothetical protein
MMMNRRSCVLLLTLVVLLQGSTARSQERTYDVDAGDWEVGVILGEPTGLSVKLWTTEETAFDFGFAWSFSKDGHLHIHADYLFHNFDVIGVEEGLLPLYFGVGGRLRLEDDSRLGVRFAVGIEYVFEEHPFSAFFEVAPIVDFIPDTEGSINGGLGFRYIF